MGNEKMPHRGSAPQPVIVVPGGAGRLDIVKNHFVDNPVNAACILRMPPKNHQGRTK